ncbi:uncharacterized membrane protein YczE [Jatrophihabitans sp. GAS493]|uniref:membrane protein YczE n=1 Tax=Jatrophihabitans sp. GAS493 TaxID=1907575 RepID=UPI000BBFEAE7|nr:hypothetical protein [Jatrophihabitans sp. GAS493]SOD73261.1 uncharacterized membrane protein YczE [Jatrophihabitans sp. GAS493]
MKRRPVKETLPRLIPRLGQLYVGLALYGLSSALLVRSKLGLDPWDVFHQGISRRTHVSIGVVVILVGALVLLLWIPLGQRPGLGTVSNVLIVGSALNLAIWLLPDPHALPLRLLYLSAGILLCGAATGLYIGARFGAGPRDGLMTGIAKRLGCSIRLARTCIELTVLAVGWLLGGTVGLGTVAFALCIGPLSQLFLGIFAPATVTSEPVTSEPVTSEPVMAEASPSPAPSSHSSRRTRLRQMFTKL